MIHGTTKQHWDSDQPSPRMTSYPIRFLDWDTRFFGSKMGVVELTTLGTAHESETAWRETLVEAKRQCYHFLLCPIDVREQVFANRILKSGAKIGDILMTFRRDLAPDSGSRNCATEVTEATEQDLGLLFEMAAASFNYSRFLQDPRFDKEKAGQLYQNWLAESYRNKRVLVAKNLRENVPSVLGFVSFALDPGAPYAVIRLLATHSEARGLGVGKSLVTRVFDLALQAGLQGIQVGTQINNYSAIRFYEKMGFRCHDLKYRFHLWMDEWIV